MSERNWILKVIIPNQNSTSFSQITWNRITSSLFVLSDLKDPHRPWFLYKTSNTSLNGSFFSMSSLFSCWGVRQLIRRCDRSRVSSGQKANNIPVLRYKTEPFFYWVGVVNHKQFWHILTPPIFWLFILRIYEYFLPRQPPNWGTTVQRLNHT